MQTQYTVAIIGCGRMGFLFDANSTTLDTVSHLGAYTQHPRTRVVAVCDADPSRARDAAARYRVARIYTDYHEMLRSDRYDIVSICLPTPLHAPACIAAAQAGARVVFCEKPIASSLADADAMITACAQHKVLLAVNHSRRWDARFQAARTFLDAQRIGEVSLVHAFAPVGLANSGTHLFDLLRWYFGDVEWVSGILLPDLSTDPGGRGSMRFRSGVHCTVDSSWREYVHFGVEVYGTTGLLRVGGTIHAGKAVELFEASRSTTAAGIAELTEVEYPVPTWSPPIVAAIENIVQSIEGREQLRCTGADGAAALELTLAFHASARANEERIHLPLRRDTSAHIIPRATSFTKDGQLA